MNPVCARPCRVSFLIVAHNPGRWLAPCLKSAFAQTSVDVEVVLVDNASTDGSIAEAAASVAGKALKVITAPTNLGPYAGAELGFSHCEGDFVARMDADDISLAPRISRQLEVFHKYPSLAVVGSDAIMVDAEGKAIGVAFALRFSWLRRRAAAFEIAIPHPTALFRREALEEAFYNPTLFSCGDLELIEYFARKGRVGTSPEILYVYRQHSGSITSSRSGLQLLSACSVKREILKCYESGGRQAVRTKTFAPLRGDQRQNLPRDAVVREFARESAANGEGVAAAYFASLLSPLNGLASAAVWGIRRPSQIPSLCTLVFTRLAYPLWKRHRQRKIIKSWHVNPSYSG